MSTPLTKNTPASCSEKSDVVFLKVHKTGSSTVANVLQRFGHFRGLSFALPNKTVGEVRYNYFGEVGETLKEGGIKPSKSGLAKYNILYNHVVFNRKAFLRQFPKEAYVYITLLREPVSQFLSSLLFFLHEDILAAAMNNITAYLENPEVYEPKEGPYLSFTDNRQALDLGVPYAKIRNVKYIINYIKMLDKVFDLVMIMEYFDESLVLLKRRLCWKLKDIIYMRKNIAYKSFDFNLNATEMNLLKKWALADHLIYTHFYRKFYETLKKEAGIMEESHHFKGILERTQMFCNGSAVGSSLFIEGSPWNEAFTVRTLDCAYMILGELQFLQKIIHDQHFQSIN
jgi:hypothetical protein